MKNITYLFGAGASCGTIPVVGKFNSGLIEFNSFLRSKANIGTHLNNEERQLINTLTSSIDELTLTLEKHASFDTFARKLYLQGKIPKLNEFKTIIALFILFREFNYGTDKRYDLLLATLFEKQKNNRSLISISKTINFLSWNYDTQIENSVNSFNDSTEFDDSIIDFFPNENQLMNQEKSCLVKLNGSAALYYDGRRHSRINGMSFKSKEEMVSGLLERYKQRTRRPNTLPILHFSWEEDELITNTRKKALDIASQTQILVIIGYSFPTFNRTLDKEILNAMGNLEKIYVQDIDTNSAIQRMQALTNNKYNDIFVPLSNTKEFHVPFEIG
ncbi:MAG: hypothetical protein WC150_02990 [Bacteroidia bacterium]